MILRAIGNGGGVEPVDDINSHVESHTMHMYILHVVDSGRVTIRHTIPLQI